MAGVKKVGAAGIAATGYTVESGLFKKTLNPFGKEGDKVELTDLLVMLNGPVGVTP